jgi:hypothetical protein
MNYFLKTSQKDKVKLIKALELISKDEWDQAHEIAQQKEGDIAYDRIHALLHRIEGDKFNADYWYRRVGIKTPTCSFSQETKELLIYLKEE